MTQVLQADVLSRFTCLGDKCEDTCCQNWSMQVDDATLRRYRESAPQLLDAVEPSTDAPWIMRKDVATGMCVKLEGGLCGIHKQYGDRFLSDACHFYPRVTRSLGEYTLMTATMSCPEIVRQMLASPSPCATQDAEVARIPSTLKNYLPEGMTADDALAIHRIFLEAAMDESFAPEMNYFRMASVARSIERLPMKDRAQGAAFYIKNAHTWLPLAESNALDPFNLLHALCGLIVASKKKPSARLMETIVEMERALDVKLDWQNVQIEATEKSLASYQRVQAQWKTIADIFSPLLRRWLQMQISTALYPFSGLGNNFSERSIIIGVRMATIRLALMCSCCIHGSELPQDVVVRVVQSISRFLDHLGDPQFSLKIYEETRWVSENRMRGLLEL